MKSRVNFNLKINFRVLIISSIQENVTHSSGTTRTTTTTGRHAPRPNTSSSHVAAREPPAQGMRTAQSAFRPRDAFDSRNTARTVPPCRRTQMASFRGRHEELCKFGRPCASRAHTRSASAASTAMPPSARSAAPDTASGVAPFGAPGHRRTASAAAAPSASYAQAADGALDPVAASGRGGGKRGGRIGASR